VQDHSRARLACRACRSIKAAIAAVETDNYAEKPAANLRQILRIGRGARRKG
jgi:hypothetical protein